VRCASAGNDGHAGEIDRVLDGGHDKVADQYLRQLALARGATGERLLEQGHENVTERSGNQSTIDGHLRHARGEIGSLLVAITGVNRREDFLEGGKGTRGEHLGPQRIMLKLGEVKLQVAITPHEPAATMRRGRGDRLDLLSDQFFRVNHCLSSCLPWNAVSDEHK